MFRSPLFIPCIMKTGPKSALADEIKACRLCEARFAATATEHEPRPVPWFRPGAKIVICGQAPGARVHTSGRPFTDPSGDRLRDWMGIEEETFYDLTRVSVLPMAFCFPGYNDKGSDLPPPPICHRTWHERVMAHLGDVPLLLLVGGYSQKWRLKSKQNVTDCVRDWRAHAPEIVPLPHPSWRNTAWIKKNPWFEKELLPVLRARVQEVLA